MNEIQDVIEDFFHFLVEENDIETESEFTQKLICRIILLLSVSVLSRNVYLNTVALSCSSLRLTKIAEVFLKTIKITFNNLKVQSSRKNSNSITINSLTKESHLKNLEEQKEEELFDKTKKDEDLNSFGDLADNLNDFIYQNNIDLILDYQNLLSILMPNLGLQLINLKSKNMTDMNVEEGKERIHEHTTICDAKQNDKNNTNYNNNNDKNSNDNNNNHYSNNNKEISISDDAALLSTSKTNIEKETELFELIDIAIFTSAILRHHSNEECYRKKLNHLKIMENIFEFLRSLGSFTVGCQKEISFNSEKYRKNLISRKNGIDIDQLLKKMVKKMSEIAVQLVVVVRNFSIDIKGRFQILNKNMIGLMCSLLKPYKKYPELCLNCVRVTAKLSLQDNFRAQINSKSSHIKCLIDVLVCEGMFCSNIMNGNDKLNNVEKNEFEENDFYPNSAESIQSTDNEKNQQKIKNSFDVNNKYEKEIIKTEKNNQKEVEEVEIDHWPFWYTWPLISRVAFTLGNLTTSNNTNRYERICNICL